MKQVRNYDLTVRLYFYGLLFFMALSFASDLFADTESSDKNADPKSDVEGLSLFMSAGEQVAAEERVRSNAVLNSDDNSGGALQENTRAEQLEDTETTRHNNYSGLVLRGDVVLGMWVNAERLSDEVAFRHFRSHGRNELLRLPRLLTNAGKPQ